MDSSGWIGIYWKQRGWFKRWWREWKTNMLSLRVAAEEEGKLSKCAKCQVASYWWVLSWYVWICLSNSLSNLGMFSCRNMAPKFARLSGKLYYWMNRRLKQCGLIYNLKNNAGISKQIKNWKGGDGKVGHKFSCAGKIICKSPLVNSLNWHKLRNDSKHTNE